MFFLYKHIYVKRDPLTGPLLAQGHNLNKLSKGPPDDTKSIFSKNSFKNTIRVSNNLDPDQADILSGLIWVQIVCKSYQQTTLVGKELNKNAQLSSGARG